MLRFFEISLARHTILNPFSSAKLDLLGELCQLRAESTLLDLACGKGELACRFADRYRVRAVGVDISAAFLAAARERGGELGVGHRLRFEQAEAAEYVRRCDERFDTVGCVGATWIGGGLSGTLDLMKPALRDACSQLLVGEPFWLDDPPDEVWKTVGPERDLFVSLDATRARFESAGLELIEMVLADHDDWDRYEAAQWRTVSDWLLANPQDPDAPGFGETAATHRKQYLEHQRRYLGWGVFVLRPATGPANR